MITPDNVFNILFIGAAITVLLALTIIGQFQEIRFKRMYQAHIKEMNRGITNYARKQAQLATAAKTIRKGHE